MAEQLLKNVIEREHEGRRNSLIVMLALVVAVVLAVAALVVWAHAAT